MGKTETFEALQEALSRGDSEAMREYMTDDFVLHEPPALPFGGDFFGPEGYIDLVRQLQACFELELVSSRQTEARDDLLLIELVIKFKSRKTGESAEMDVVDLYHFAADGRICRMDGYYRDPELIAAIAAGAPRPARA